MARQQELLELSLSCLAPSQGHPWPLGLWLLPRPCVPSSSPSFHGASPSSHLCGLSFCPSSLPSSPSYRPSSHLSHPSSLLSYYPSRPSWHRQPWSASRFQSGTMPQTRHRLI